MNLLHTRDYAAFLRAGECGDTGPGPERLQSCIEILRLEQGLCLFLVGEQDIDVGEEVMKFIAP